MTDVRTDTMDRRQLCVELLRSIRDLDCRIEELCSVTRQNDRRTQLVSRIGELTHTRFNLVYSFLDTLGTKSGSRCLLDSFPVEYRDLARRLVR